jgi:glycosyltransferase involved in cell wall biosynthesis
MSEKTRNIIVYTQWPFFDGLILSYVLPYVFMIKNIVGAKSNIYIVTQEKNIAALDDAEPNTIIEELKQKNIYIIPEQYYSMGLKKLINLPLSFLKLLIIIYRKKIDIIHTQAMSAGMIGCILSWLTGKKLIADSYEPLAESMVEGNIWHESSLAFKVVKYFEKKQAQQASYIIADTASMKDYAKKTYGIELQNFYWKPACVDLNVFKYSEQDAIDIRTKYDLQDKVVGIYVGKFGSQYLEHEVFDFFMACKNFWGDKFRVLLLTSHSDEEVLNYCQISGFSFSLISKVFVPHPEVKKYLCAADFAITPVKPLPSKRYCTPIKDGEYWALGLPVVITENISDDSDIIEKHNIGVVIRSYNSESYNEVVSKLNKIMERTSIREEIRNYAIQYRGYEIAQRVYESIYNNI